MSNQGLLTRQEFEKQLVLKAWKDPAFKAQLLKDPKAAVQSQLQVMDKNFSLPADMTVKVVEENPNTLYIVLPLHPQEALQKVEFSDQQLEDAAGGSVTVVTVNNVSVAVNNTNIDTTLANVVLLNYVMYTTNVNAQINSIVNVNIC